MTNSSLPKCQKDLSAVKTPGFTYQPQTIQDFLYYRHCREFPLILDAPGKCEGDDDIFLLLVIKSSPVNFKYREVLRKTWAEERLYKGMWIRRVFITGTMTDVSERQRTNKLLRLEQRTYNDILQWDFNDTFFNLTLKQMLFLEWMEKSCWNVHFLFNSNDDIFANPDNMVEYLQSLKDNDGGKHLFTGHLLTDPKPDRWLDSKYFLPFTVYYPDTYPPYCAGGGILLSFYTALSIHKISKFISYIPIDDAYMGMCLAETNLAPSSHSGWYAPSRTLDTYDLCFLKELLVLHKFSPVQLNALWNRIHDSNLICGTLKKPLQDLIFKW
ncbi:N-acetyllactosaminide beta-1,3-N-acetylglucosaminyltransferase 3-like [Notolabrus celidotus]|uniref:N-acetyllactosaminide beta-1,3-N-acetylglucosaminyltransferase 3-like n=1 Tax=Notolabrus celidotus TaxID=1203425 RepID=UPI00148F4671|nr:N-acetyllactosaminide beta-1,3-N-acetylglucosaminyltransferase 3-like [Notolabrus celidotus]